MPRLDIKERDPAVAKNTIKVLIRAEMGSDASGKKSAWP
jgi:hypothetical protein